MNQHLAQNAPEQITQRFQELSNGQAFNNLNCLQQGTLVHKLGVAQYLLNQELKAIQSFLMVADTIWKSCPNVPAHELANSIYNIGVCYQYSSKRQLAKRYIDQAIDLIEEDPTCPKIELAAKYHGAGIFYVEIKDLATAEIYLLNALNIYRKIPGRAADQFDLLNRLLILALDFKKYENAIEFFDDALDLQAEFPMDIAPIDLATIYLNAATSYLELSNFNLAHKLATQSMLLIKPSLYPDIYSNALEILGMIQKKTGRLDSARAYYQRVIDIRMASEGTFRHSYQSRSIAYENLSELQLILGDYTKALNSVNHSIRILCPGLNLDHEANPIISLQYLSDPVELVRKLAIKASILYQNALDYSNEDLLLKSLHTMVKLDSVVGASIARFTSDHSQLEFLHVLSRQYSLAIDICLQLSKQTENNDFVDQAYFFSSRSKALILKNHLIEVETLDSILTPREILREQTLSQRIADINNLLQYEKSNIDSLRRLSLSAQLDLEIFYQELNTTYPGFTQKKRMYTQVPTRAEIQTLLSKEHCLIDFFYGIDYISAFCVTADTFLYARTNIDHDFDEILNKIIVSQYTPQEPFAYEASIDLYDKLLASIVEQLPKKIVRMSILPHGKLHSLSMEAICFIDKYGQQKYLLDNYAISYAFSTGLIAAQKKENKNLHFVGYGTNYSDNLNRRLHRATVLQDSLILSSLDMAEVEVDQVSTAFRGETRLGRQATLDDFIKNAPDADIIYLSLHGLVNYDEPNKSCIIFDDRSDPYILSPYILRNQKLQADLVMLSSCHTASGKFYQGEGVSGMTRSFLYAGARNVISSLWSATEWSAGSTLATLLNFVKQGYSKDVALQKAKISFLQEAPPSQQHPYYWANFVLVGRSIGNLESEGTALMHSSLLPISLVILILIGVIIRKKIS